MRDQSKTGSNKHRDQDYDVNTGAGDEQAWRHNRQGTNKERLDIGRPHHHEQPRTRSKEKLRSTKRRYYTEYKIIQTEHKSFLKNNKNEIHTHQQ